MGRNSKARGASAERSLAKLLSEKYDLPVKRVARSGALKYFAGTMVGNSDNYRGDLQLDCGKSKIRIEVKTRVRLPNYIKDGSVGRVYQYCYLYTMPQFITLLTKGDLVDSTKYKVITTAKCKGLLNWFEQDDSDIVAMKETSKSTWYFAVKEDVIDKIGGKY